MFLKNKFLIKGLNTLSKTSLSHLMSQDLNLATPRQINLYLLLMTFTNHITKVLKLEVFF